MRVVNYLEKIYKNYKKPFLIHKNKEIKFSDLSNYKKINLEKIKQGDVVTLVGDFDISTIAILLYLIDLNTIIFPITKENKNNHPNYLKSVNANVIIESNKVTRKKVLKENPLIKSLKKKKNLV